MIVDHHFQLERATSRFPLVLYGAAIAIALGAAAIASTVALAPHDSAQPMLVVAASRPAAADRIAGIIEPVASVPADVARTTQMPVVEPPKSAVVQAEVLAALPPKPPRRPCLECVAPSATPVAIVQPVAQAPVAAVAPAEVEYDVASAVPDGPVPPLPVGRVAGEGTERGLLVRSGEAVVSGSSDLVGAAWTFSGAAVGGLVRGVHRLAF